MNAVSPTLRDFKKRIAPTPVARLDDFDGRSVSEKIAAFVERVFNPPLNELRPQKRAQ